MIERWPSKGDEIQLFELTREEIIRQNRRDNWTRRKAIVLGTIKRWLGWINDN